MRKLFTLSALFLMTWGLQAQVITTFPYVQDFESFSTCSGGCASACALPTTSGWINATGDDQDWWPDFGGTSSLNTGPSVDHNPGTGSGNYLYTETSGCNGNTANLVSPYFDFSSFTAPKVEFWYHMYGATMGTMHIDVDTTGYGDWKLDIVTSWTANVDQWQFKDVSLVDLAGMDSARFRIRGITGTSFTSDMAVDDFKVYEPQPYDLQMNALVAPVSPACSFTSTETVSVEIENAGINSINYTDISVTFTAAGPTTTGPITDTLSGSGSLAPGATLVYTFTGTANMAASGAYTFSTAVNLLASSGNTDGNLTNNLDTALIQPGLSGTYTINSGSATGGTNYASFGAAVTALQTFGVCGPVVFNVVSGSGPYNERVALDSIQGASSTNTITFNGGSTKEKLTYAATTTGDWETFRLDGAKHITLKNLTIENTGGTVGIGVKLTNQADSNMVDSCVIRVDSNSTSSNFVGISAASPTSAIGTGTPSAQYTMISNNLIVGGYSGVVLLYQTITVPGLGNQVLNNKIYNASSRGIYTYYQEGISIIDNDIQMRSGITSGYGMYLFYNDILNVIGNNIKTTLHGMYIFRTNYNVGSGNGLTRIVNNMISNDPQTSATSGYGIWFTSNCYDVKVWHNSVSLSSGTNNLRALYLSMTSPSGFDIRNNSLAVFPSSTSNYAMYATTASMAGVTDFNYNNFFTADTGRVLYLGSTALTYGAGAIPTVAGANSLFGDPVYIDNGDDLHTKFTQLNDVGDNSVGVGIDIDGDSRPIGTSTTVDIGADEYTPPQNDAGVTTLLQPTLPICSGSTNVVVTIRNAGLDTINSVSVSWTVNGTAQTGASLTNLGLLTGDTLVVPLGSLTIAGNQTYDLVIYTSNPNGSADEDNANDTLKFLGLRTGLTAGTYTINSGAVTSGSNYQSFADAVSDLNTFGVCGPVVFDVVAGSGPYNESVTLGEVQGTSVINTITFNGGATKETVYVSSSNVVYRGVFNLVGADYITIKNLTLANYDPTTGAGVLLRDQANFNTIDSCVIILDTALSSTSAGLAGIVAAAPTSATSTTLTNESANNLTVTHNVVRGGYYGLAMMYLNTTTLASSNTVRFNRFEDVYLYGIYSYYQNAPLITNNRISFRPVTTNTVSYGIYTFYNDALKLISNNIVGARYWGIYLSSANYQGGTPTSRGQLINNMVSIDTVYSSTLYGIYLTGNCRDIDLFHNSVSLNRGPSNTSSALRGLYVASTAISGLDIRNNVFANFNTGGAGHAAYLVNAANATSFNYNCFYNDGFTNLVYIAGTTYDSSTVKGGGGFNQASFSADPGFTNNVSDLHAGKSAVLWDRGNNAAGVSDDIDGDTRPGFSTAIVDVGADEFEPPAIQGTLVSLTTPSSGCGLTDSTVVGMAFRNSGTDTLYSVNFTYVLNNGTPVTETYNDTLLPGQFFTYNFTATANMQAIQTYTLNTWIAVAGDTCNFDDSLLNITVVNVPTVATYPYVQDFENGAGGWIAEGSAEWELGQPAGTVIDTASSGLNAWVTDLDNTYESNACGNVISPCFDFTSLGLPEVSLAVWWDSRSSWDGMMLEATTDNGASWQKIGAVGDPNNWYNDNSLYGLGQNGCAVSSNEDGWGGNGTNGSGGWLLAVHEVPQLAGEPGVRFRLYFGSSIITPLGNGVAFDDFAVRDLPPIDVGATKLISPKANQCGDSVLAVQVEIENFGSAAQTNIPVRVRVDSSGFLLATLNATYTDTLSVKGVDTVTVGVFNSYRGGTYQFSAFTMQTGDADNTNDSILNLNRTIVGIPYPPNVVGDTSCAADSFLLTIVPDSGVTYAWFDSVGGMPIQIGDSLQTPFLTQSRTYYVSAFAPQVGDSLVTDLTGTNGCGGGNMFNITALSSFDLDGVSVRLGTSTGTSTPISVYFIPSGTYVGNETNASAWTLHASGTVVSNGTAVGATTRFDFANPLPITAGVTYAIYVEASVRYSTGSFPTSNSDLTFSPGVGLCSSFGGLNNPRTFNGVLHYSSSGCNGDVAAVQAVISSPPPVDLGPDVVTCGDVILDAGANWATYDWNTGDNTQTITVTQTGTYSVTITNQDGCIGSDTINVITNPNPPVELGADTTVCGAYLLDAGNPGATWTWQDGSNSQTYLATSSGLYFVNVVNATTGCSTRDTVDLVINAIPPVDLGMDRTECDQAVLDAGNPGLPTAWNTGATTQTITVTTSGQYYVDVTDPATGCVGQDTVNLGVAPSPTVALGADTVICDGDVLLLDAGNPGSSYTWSSGGSGQTDVVSTAGTYSVLVTDVNGCEGTDTIMVDVAPPAVADFNVNQVAFTYTFNFFSNATGSGNLSYSWSFGDNNTSTQENPSHTYGFEGNYIVCLTVTDECGSDEYCDTITVSLTNAIDDGLLAGAIDLFPSPTDGKVFVKIQDLDADVDVAITDMTGRTIQTRRILRFEQNQAIEFDLTEEAEGVYLVRFEAEGRRLLRKVVLER